MKTLITAKRLVEFPIRSEKIDGKTYICKSDIFNFLGLKYPYPEEIATLLKSIDKKDTKTTKVTHGEKEYSYALIIRKTAISILDDIASTEDKDIVENASKLRKLLKETLKK